MGKIFQPITEQLNQYITDCSLRESSAQANLRKMTNEKVADHSHLATTAIQAQFIGFLVALIGAKKAIEVGVFTGGSSLAIAQALPEDGRLIACDVSAEYAEMGRPCWQEAGVLHKIDLRIGRALGTLQGLLEEEAGTFDFIFVDANKQNYRDYYEISLQLLREGGLLVLDNMILLGPDRVMDRSREATRAIDDLNYLIREDRRVEASLLPLEQGVYLVRKIGLS